MEALRRSLLKRETYKPPPPVLPWVPACEYQVVITVALIAMIGAYFALLGTVFQHFFGIRNKRAIEVIHTGTSNRTSVLLMDEGDSEGNQTDQTDQTEQTEQTDQTDQTDQIDQTDQTFLGDSKPRRKHVKNFEYRAYHCNMHLVINGVIPVFFAQGILMFRVWCCYNRKVVKLLHTIILGITLPLAGMSLPFMARWSAYLPHPVNGEHYWSLHAWMGLIFFLLFLGTFFSGIYFFYWKVYRDPYGSAELRSKFVPYHSFMGMAIFIITVAQVVTGLTNYASAFTWDTWEASSVYDYHYYEHDYLRKTSAVKMCLVLYIISAATVMYALSREDFRHRGRIILTKDTEWTEMKK